jgi:hypothetical protein
MMMMTAGEVSSTPHSVLASRRFVNLITTGSSRPADHDRLIRTGG